MKIVVYSMNGCAECVKATNLLTAKGVPHTVVKLDEDEAAYEFFKAQGHRSVPQIYQDGELYVEGGYKGLLQLSVQDFDKLK